jgi:TonB family protein
MTRDVIFSAALHLAIIAMVVVTSPLDLHRKPDYGEVIRVALYAQSELTPSEPVPSALEPLNIPTPAIDEPLEVPIGKPVVQEEVAVAQVEPEPERPLRTTPAPEESPTEGQGDGTGDAEIHSPITGGGSPFAGARIDNASFNYPYWFTQAFNKILRNWRNPVAADGSIVCVVYFQVIKSGRVIEVEVHESSGLPMFDEACLHAIDRSSPFPPLPRQFRDEIIGITLPFKYEPR